MPTTSKSEYRKDQIDKSNNWKMSCLKKRKFDEFIYISMGEYKKCISLVEQGQTSALHESIREVLLTKRRRMSNIAELDSIIRENLEYYEGQKSSISKKDNQHTRLDALEGLRLLSQVTRSGHSGYRKSRSMEGSECTKQEAKLVKKRIEPSIPFNNGTFPFKLHEILSYDEYHHIIRWQDHGRAWKVHDPSELAKIIPKFLPRQTKYSSFVRQVNLWGFTRITTGPDRNCYYHNSFTKKNPMKCREMIRKKNVPKKQLVPNFYD